MVLGRKFVIWFISFGVVLAAFLLYRSINNTEIIELTTLNYGIDQNDPNRLISDSNAGRIGQAKLEYLQQARFETVDIKTRKLKRVVGFEKVLHKTGNNWELDKPYMNMFQGNFRYNITADIGTVEIENVQGANPAPKTAVLKGKVVVHIIPESASQSDSFVYLNEVTFDSDRSMLFSDDDVNFVSADAHLVGRGLEIIYNSITSRLEYFEVKQVDYLNIMSIDKANRIKDNGVEKDSTIAYPSVPSAASSPQSAQTLSASVEAQPTATVASVPTQPVQTQSIAAKTQPAVSEDGGENYSCIFRDQVVLEYADEILLTDELAITNLIWSSSPQQDEQGSSVEQKPVASANTNVTLQTPAGKPSTPSNPSSVSSAPRTVIATVKCKGPMIVRPDSYKGRDDYNYAPFKKYEQLPAEVVSKIGKRNVLLAVQVSYDYKQQIAKAHNQVELVAYPKTGMQNDSQKPFIISSKKGAEFITAQNQAVFYSDVKGSFIKQTAYYDEENVFYGDKLVVDLISAKQSEASKSVISANLSHIAVTGPGVRLESERTLNGEKLSHIRLKSKRIDYDKLTEEIIASGRGKIEYANEARPQEPAGVSKSASSTDKLCYAIVEGFDKLIWDTNSMHVKALSDKTGGIHIGYLPFTKGKAGKNNYGRKITIDTRQIDIDYYEPQYGKTQIKQLFATGGIVFYEQDRYEFAGNELSYNAEDDFMVVTGSKEMPCMLNGVFAEGIEYNLKTGSASAVMSGGVGVIPVKE
ncbi:MAG: hypothetical protein PHP01_09315 [Phycisphaerae bacterium]|nr:hypothetical protein [Phycisphaerae bacterium]